MYLIIYVDLHKKDKEVTSLIRIKQGKEKGTRGNQRPSITCTNYKLDREIDSTPQLANNDVKMDIQGELPKDEDAIKDTSILEVKVNIVEDDPSEDEQRRSFLKYLSNKELLDEPKLRSRVQKQAWQFKVTEGSKDMMWHTRRPLSLALY